MKSCPLPQKSRIRPRPCMTRRPESARIQPAIARQWMAFARLLGLPLCAVITVISIPSPARADGGWTSVEHFNCGALGPVTLRSRAIRFSRKAGHTVAAAQISIPKKRLQQNGILHSVMAGNDRTFTRTEKDLSRQVDDTSPANPIMMNVRVGSYFYGKHRQEITIALLQEAYTCIPM